MSTKTGRGRPKASVANSNGVNPLSHTIRTTRVGNGLGLSDVAKAAGVSVQYISNIEHGRAPLAWNKVKKVAKALGVSVERLATANLLVSDSFKEFRKLVG